ncbi:MAG: hypothetical protein U0075_05700 [Thermomicrobiales bacterium]
MPEREAPRLAVSYFGNRYPAHARRDMVALADAGVDDIVLVMSESDLRWNPGTMADLVQIARDAGLEPWLTAWAIGGVFGGETASYAVGAFPEACQRDNTGAHIPALCPRQEPFRQVMRAWMDTAVATGVRTVQWDEPQLTLSFKAGAVRHGCCCAACQAAFRQQHGEDLPPVATVESERFFADLLTEVVTWLVAEARQRGLESAIVLLPDENYDTSHAAAMAAQPGVSYFGSTPFTLRNGVAAAEIPEYLRGWVDRGKAAVSGTPARTYAWVQAFDVAAGHEEEITLAITSLADAGVDLVAVWSYRACEAMSGLACEDPDAAWDAVLAGFATVRGMV